MLHARLQIILKRMRIDSLAKQSSTFVSINVVQYSLKTIHNTSVNARARQTLKLCQSVTRGGTEYLIYS